MSLNKKDPNAIGEFPNSSLPSILDAEISRLSGIIPTPDASMLEADDRLAAIWNR